MVYLSYIWLQGIRRLCNLKDVLVSKILKNPEQNLDRDIQVDILSRLFSLLKKSMQLQNADLNSYLIYFTISILDN